MRNISSARRSALLLLLVVGVVVTSGCENSHPPPPAKAVTALADDSRSRQIEAFCGHCHAPPRPESYARRDWPAEVSQGFRFYEGAENLHLAVPPEADVVAYYVALAPESIAPPAQCLVEANSLFQRQSPATQSLAVSVSDLVSDPESKRMWGCDMRTGAILEADAQGVLSEVARPLELSNPSRLTTVDLDHDGQTEILVSDLGSFFPQDHKNGAVWKLDPQSNWEATNLLHGVSRVCDVQPGDLDGDGDLDLVVAEFGWRRTGRVLILWNEGSQSSEPWRIQVLDARHGAIDVPVIDLNQDGRLDIVVLLSQEFENVLVYLNRGEGKFEPQSIYEAGDPSFGSSGIQVVDFDQDGDIDLIHTNGDSFDSSHVKPFHGIRWLENRGSFPFVVHEVTRLAGVHQAMAGDIDQDGDLDLAAVSLLPPAVLQQYTGLPSVVWVEQTSPGTFATHVVEIDSASHPACELQDVNADGDLDLVATNFRWQEDPGPPVTWFHNQGRQLRTVSSKR